MDLLEIIYLKSRATVAIHSDFPHTMPIVVAKKLSNPNRKVRLAPKIEFNQ